MFKRLDCLLKTTAEASYYCGGLKKIGKNMAFLTVFQEESRLFPRWLGKAGCLGGFGAALVFLMAEQGCLRKK